LVTNRKGKEKGRGREDAKLVFRLVPHLETTIPGSGMAIKKKNRQERGKGFLREKTGRARGTGWVK